MVMTDLAGELKVRVVVRDGRVSGVDIESTRPRLANRLLAGKPAEEAVAMVPRLFSICGRSQHVAAELALAAARGVAGTADAAQVRRVEAEMAQEYLWRMLIDWARGTGAAADAITMASARSALARDDRDALRVIVEREVLGADARRWHEHRTTFEAWIARGASAAARFLGQTLRDAPHEGASDVSPLPRFDAGDTAERIVAQLESDSGFERRPTLDGKPAETGAMARLDGQSLSAELVAAYGRSTLARFAARLSELVRIVCNDDPTAPLAGSLNLAPGRGLAWVETARGLLLHQIDLDGERIARYRVVAPTEWNFHPQGALAAAMAGRPAPSEEGLRRRAERLIQSLDPCVDYTLDVAHA
jgi:coenzyme F420-reducing hydrogenase alpha subunit